MDCEGKKLSSLPDLSSLTNVTIHRLNLTENYLDTIPEEAFKDLRIIEIELSRNPLNRKIHKDAFKGLEHYLEYLSLQETNLNQKPSTFLNGLIMLRTLDLSKTDSTILQHLENSTFGNLRMIETLHLSECGIQSIREDAFVNAESIMSLKLDKNQLTSIPTEALQKLYELVYLYMDENRITEIKARAFVGLMNLQKISLVDNKITNHSKIDKNAFLGVGHNLMELDLSFNDLKQLPSQSFGYLFNLGTFRISDNLISNIKNSSFEGMTHLMTLDLSGNEGLDMHSGNLRGLELSLVNLYLARTGMTQDTKLLGSLKRFRYLRELDLSSNDLGILKNGTFSKLGIKRILLEDSGITEIEPGTFSEMIPPITVKLSRNRIENMDFLTDTCLFERLELNSNPIDCSCDFLKIASLKITELVGKCDTPHEANGLDFVKASKNEDIIDKCQWGNETEPATCDWLVGVSSHLHTNVHFYLIVWIITMIVCL